MNIEVRSLTGRTVQYYMSRESRVRELQNEIAEREGLAPDSQYIISDKRRVGSEERLEDIGMQSGYKLHLLSLVTAGMNVKVIDINGRELTIEIQKKKTTVNQLKIEIEDKKGIPVWKQRLVMCDGLTEIEMKDKDKVTDYMGDSFRDYTISLVIKSDRTTLEPLYMDEAPGGSFWSWCHGRCCIL